MRKTPEEIREKTINFLWDVVKLSADEVFKKSPTEIKKKHRELVSWIEGKGGEAVAVPIDKLKAADLLLKYLTAEGKMAPNGEAAGVVIYGEEFIDE